MLNFYKKLNKGSHEIPYFKLKQSFVELVESGRSRKTSKDVALVAKMFKDRIQREKGRVPHYI